MNSFNDYVRYETRRQFFSRGANAVGWGALAALLGSEGLMPAVGAAGLDRSITPLRTHFPPKAKHVIYLHMVGGPSQMDTYDYKPQMNKWFDKDLPDSIRMGQRLTTMTSGQKRFPDRSVEIQVRSPRQVRDVGLRAAPEHGPDGRRHVLHPEHAHRGHQSRAGHLLHPDRQPDYRPTLPGRMGFLRPGVAQRQSAHVRRPGRQTDQHRADPGDFRSALVLGLPVG